MGNKAYVGTQEEFIALSNINTQPLLLVAKDFTEMVQKDVATSKDAADPHSYDTQMVETTSYAVSGWFQWVAPETRSTCHLLFRLTNTPADTLADVAELGDRTLAVFYCQDFVFSTYNIGTLDKGT